MKQLSILVVNKAGSLREASTVLSDSGVNIRAVAAFDTPEFGILRMVVDDCEKAKDVLTQKGFVVRLNDNNWSLIFSDNKGINKINANIGICQNI